MLLRSKLQNPHLPFLLFCSLCPLLGLPNSSQLFFFRCWWLHLPSSCSCFSPFTSPVSREHHYQINLSKTQQSSQVSIHQKLQWLAETSILKFQIQSFIKSSHFIFPAAFTTVLQPMSLEYLYHHQGPVKVGQMDFNVECLLTLPKLVNHVPDGS